MDSSTSRMTVRVSDGRTFKRWISEWLWLQCRSFTNKRLLGTDCRLSTSDRARPGLGRETFCKRSGTPLSTPSVVSKIGFCRVPLGAKPSRELFEISN